MNGADLANQPRGRRMFSRYDGTEIPVKYNPDDDIKDYAETTMNELLGWYGYEKVDSRDTQGLNLQHFASTTTEGDASPTRSLRDGSEEESGDPQPIEGASSPILPRPRSSSPEGSSSAVDEVTRQHQQMVSALSSVIKHPGAPDSPNLPPGCIVCAWCQKVGMKLFTLKTTNGSKAFCSELCFTQCRRASFKKNKVCDWCKHVRHTVNYVDFQDGEQQLQFCSDKCLNQYKMNIFCKETQAHLQMHTHLKEAACKVQGSSSGAINLITPELWLRDCGKVPPANGGMVSPKGQADPMDILGDGNGSDENIPTVPLPPTPPPQPPPQVSSSRLSEPHSMSPLPSTKEGDEERLERRRSAKVRDKLSRRVGKTTRFSNKRSRQDGKSHHGHRLKEKKSNGISYQRMHNSSKSSVRSSLNSLPSGLPSQLSPQSMIPPSSVPPLHQTLPPRLHHPPMLDHLRPPFLPPNLTPSPFQIFAQQQMEAFLRTQNRMGIRPEGPSFPLPPWGLQPPLPRCSQPPHTSSVIPNQQFSALSHMARNNRNEIQSSQKPPKIGNSKHSKHPHHHHSVPCLPPPPPLLPPPPLSLPPPPPPHHSTNTEKTPKTSGAPPLLPPVTVMVPFPVVLPMPFPIPIPIPISEQLLEQFKKRQNSKYTVESSTSSNTKDSTGDNSNSDAKHPLEISEPCNLKKTPKDFINRKTSPIIDESNLLFPIEKLSDFSVSSKEYCISPLTQNDSFDSLEAPSNLSNTKQDRNHIESPRSFSSLSDTPSVDDNTDHLSRITPNDKDINSHQLLTQLSYAANDKNAMFSDTVTTLSESRKQSIPDIPFNGLDSRRTFSPLPSTEGRRRFPTLSASPRDCKRHCLREGLNLVICKESV